MTPKKKKKFWLSIDFLPDDFLFKLNFFQNFVDDDFSLRPFVDDINEFGNVDKCGKRRKRGRRKERKVEEEREKKEKGTMNSNEEKGRVGCLFEKRKV